MKTKILSVGVLISLSLFVACKNSSQYEAINNADTAAISADSTTQPKIIKTASINFKVKNVSQTSEVIANLTSKYQGTLIKHNFNTSVEQTKDFQLSDDSVMHVSSMKMVADITVKIPSVKLDEFMNDVSKLSIYVTERKLDMTDKSLDYLSDQLKLRSRSQIISQQAKGRITIKNPDAILFLKDDMIDQKINNMKIDDAVKFSVVDLHCYQSNIIAKEVSAIDNPSSYKLPFFSRLRFALQNGVAIFQEVVLGVINLWLVILTGIFIWIAYRYYKKKTHNHTLNNLR